MDDAETTLSGSTVQIVVAATGKYQLQTVRHSDRNESIEGTGGRCPPQIRNNLVILIEYKPVSY